MVVLDLHLHAGARQAAGADAHGCVVERMMRWRQDGDVAGDLAQAEILDQHRAQRVQRADLVGAVHRRPGIDDVAQAGMVMAHDRRVLDQQLEDGEDGEHVADPVAFD